MGSARYGKRQAGGRMGGISRLMGEGERQGKKSRKGVG